MNSFYYLIKPFIPRHLQIIIRRQLALRRRKLCSHIWPIDPRASKPPDEWPGWPGKKRFALVLSHDVDTEIGQRKCPKLIEIEERMGFRSSFNFVPERYNVSPELRHYLTENDFEVAVHGLNHDGKLFKSEKIFKQRALQINHYLREWKAVGFHSPSMHRNLNWTHDLDIEYDQSTFDTDPFEPQPDGARTIFPFYVRGNKSYVELPYTLPQDHSLFIIMKENSIAVWKEKLDWISEKGGMALLNCHPDYMNFDRKKCLIDEYPVKYYTDFLDYLTRKYKGQYWHVLPKDLSLFWSNKVSNANLTK